MVHASLIAYLKTAQLGPFVRLSPREAVLNALGPPPNWDGWGGIAYEDSAIWVYDAIQFNFDDKMRLADTHIGFDSTLHDSTVTYSDWTNPFIALDDLAIDAIYTPERFARTMAANDIATTQSECSRGRIMINTHSGVQARFCAMTDMAASMKHEAPVRTSDAYLHRITTVILA